MRHMNNSGRPIDRLAASLVKPQTLKLLLLCLVGMSGMFILMLAVEPVDWIVGFILFLGPAALMMREDRSDEDAARSKKGLDR